MISLGYEQRMLKSSHCGEAFDSQSAPLSNAVRVTLSLLRDELVYSDAETPARDRLVM